jgi:nitrite reductase (NO-forming)
MNDGFWHRAWQVVLLFTVVAMMAATIIAHNGDLSAADVREIIAAEGLWGGASPATADGIRPQLTPIASLGLAPSDEVHATYAPAVPAPIVRSEQRIFEVGIEVLEGVCSLDPGKGVATEMWGFRIAGDTQVVCGSPGPVLRGRVGDVARITLTNPASNTNPHNTDFHAVTGQGGGAADLTVNPGESGTIEVRLLYPGAFMYHCAYGDVPVHIAHGMYGMFIVDPESPLPAVDHEWAVMQSEWYVGEADAGGIAPFDTASLLVENPAFVTFNGRVGAIAGDDALRMRVGERARIYFVNEGLNLDSNFHPIGSHWDLVYPEAATHPANSRIRGSQSTLVVAGGGTVVELDALVPSTIVLVDHALVRTFYKGALGTIVIEGPENPEVFGRIEPDGSAGTTTTEPAAGAVDVTITVDAFNQANSEEAYSPKDVTVSIGSTVRWTNTDAIAHTVTGGTSDGSSGTPQGDLASGFIESGETFTFTFTAPGTFPYFCTPHPWMQGTVTVTQ